MECIQWNGLTNDNIKKHMNGRGGKPLWMKYNIMSYKNPAHDNKLKMNKHGDLYEPPKKTRAQIWRDVIPRTVRPWFLSSIWMPGNHTRAGICDKYGGVFYSYEDIDKVGPLTGAQIAQRYDPEEIRTMHLVRIHHENCDTLNQIMSTQGTSQTLPQQLGALNKSN